MTTRRLFLALAASPALALKQKDEGIEIGFLKDMSDPTAFVYAVPTVEGVIVKTIYREKIRAWHVQTIFLGDESEPHHSIVVFMQTEGQAHEVHVLYSSIAVEFYDWKMGVGRWEEK